MDEKRWELALVPSSLFVDGLCRSEWLGPVASFLFSPPVLHPDSDVPLGSGWLANVST